MQGGYECEGDILIVKRQDDCKSGDIAIVMVMMQP